MPSIIGRLREYVRSEVGASDEEQAIDEYVLERRDPDPNPRVRTYDHPITPDDVVTDSELQPGTYLLQEIKESGMAGDVVWTEEIRPENAPD